MASIGATYYLWTSATVGQGSQITDFVGVGGNTVSAGVGNTGSDSFINFLGPDGYDSPIYASITATSARRQVNGPVGVATKTYVDTAVANIGGGSGSPATGSDAWLKAWGANIDSLIVGSITRDGNGAATGAGVVWPDGTTGTYAGTPSASIPGAVDSYAVTYAPTSGSTRTATQPTMTRNSAGAVITRPAMTVAAGNTIVAAPSLTNTALPAISGTASVGSTLTATSGTWSATPDSFAYIWRRAGNPISGASASTYTLVSADVGSTVTVTVTATKSGYVSASATSPATATVFAPPTPSLSNTAAPTISGTAQVGQTLTTSNGSWSATPDSYSYAWLRNTTVISGATSPTYTPTSADVGNTLSATVTAAKSGYLGASVVTASTSSVTAAPSGGTSTASATSGRWWITNGNAPVARVTGATGVTAAGATQVVWVGSMPDSAARSTPQQATQATLTQTAFQVQIISVSSGAVLYDSGTQSGAAETFTVPSGSFTPTAGTRYLGQARVQSSDGQWSPWDSTRFVAPTGRTIYLEDYGAVGDGTTQSGSDYANSSYQGSLRNALSAAQPGDVVKSKSPGTVITGLSVSGKTATSSAAPFTAGMVGQKILVYKVGAYDSTGPSAVLRTTISAVSSDHTTATLAVAATTASSSTTAIVNYAEYRVGKTDVDNNTGGGVGGWTLDGTGCVFTSTDPNYAGFRTVIPDVTYRNVHYWVKNTTTRGNGQNNNDCPFFAETSAAMGLRFNGCYAERPQDAGFLFYSGPSDIHVVDCTVDHSYADGFHATGSAFDIQFVRPTAIYPGDDAFANIGYRSDGDSARPHAITWVSPTMHGQDWGRGVSFGGAYDVLMTDASFDHGAQATLLIGSDGDQANSAHCQVRGLTVTTPHLRLNASPTYTQGSGTSSVIQDDCWLKLLNNDSPTPQHDFLIENGTITDGQFLQVISYGGGTFTDSTIVMRGLTMNGQVSSGTNWHDDSTYSGHINFSGITVSS